jgi:type I restriction enzyme S subunit
MCLGRGVCSLRHKDDEQEFLYYLMRFYAHELISRESGTVFGSVNHYDIANLEVEIPPLPTQRAIAEVLASLDDKIDLLTRQNATLDALAQTYFRQWFVEEASDDWEEKNLGQYVNSITGVSYKGEYLQQSDIALVTLKNFDRTGGFSTKGYKEYTGLYKECHIVKHGDIIVAHTDLTQDAEVIGNAVFVEDNPKYKELVMTMDCSKIEIKNTLKKEFVYWLLRSSDFKDYCLGRANGSTVLHLDRKAVVEYKFLLPPMDKIIEFTTFAKDLNEKNDNNDRQIQTLQTLRDTLLPKLISGEVEVKI